MTQIEQICTDFYIICVNPINQRHLRSILYFFEKRIRILRIKMFIYPENGVKLFISNISDVVSVPDRHIYEGWVFSIQFKIEYFIRSYFAELDSGFSFDNCESLSFAGMVVVSSGNSRYSGWEWNLTTAVEFYRFNEASSVVGIKF